MRDVAVIGLGMIKWGELWEKSLRDMFVEAALKAIDDAGVDNIDVNVIRPEFFGQRSCQGRQTGFRGGIG